MIAYARVAGHLVLDSGTLDSLLEKMAFQAGNNALWWRRWGWKWCSALDRPSKPSQEGLDNLSTPLAGLLELGIRFVSNCAHLLLQILFMRIPRPI